MRELEGEMQDGARLARYEECGFGPVHGSWH